MKLKQRVEQAEKAVGVDHENVQLALIIRREFGDDDTVPHFPEPIEEWATLKAEIEQSQRRQVPCVFVEDPFAEYEARHGLEPGVISKHPLCGKVPFQELLAAATIQTQKREA